ncbi:MAG: hypothetical protein EXS13_08020 [Planctomycetes bacterium]|nr:hypothetical protein [Planctomycetota bacterium]
MHSLAVVPLFDADRPLLLVGLGDGRLMALEAPAGVARRFVARELHREPGRIRQFVELPPASGGGTPRLA